MNDLLKDKEEQTPEIINESESINETIEKSKEIIEKDISEEEKQEQRLLQLVREEIARLVCPQLALGKKIGLRMLKKMQFEGTWRAFEKAELEGIAVESIGTALSVAWVHIKQLTCTPEKEV